jgi:hypothetical protein
MASEYQCRYRWEGNLYWHECGLEPDHPTRFHRCHCGTGHLAKADDVKETSEQNLTTNEPPHTLQP